MLNKPKLFITEYNRPDCVGYNSSLADLVVQSDNARCFISCYNAAINTTEITEVDNGKTVFPHKSIDTAEIWASFPNRGTVTNIHGCSPFISSVCATFDKHGKYDTLDDLVKKITKKMKNQPIINKTIGRKKHSFQLVPRFEGALTKELRFHKPIQLPVLTVNDIYPLTGKRDCLIIPVGRYDKPGSNRANARPDARMLNSSFGFLSFECFVMQDRVTRDQALQRGLCKLENEILKKSKNAEKSHF